MYNTLYIFVFPGGSLYRYLFSLVDERWAIKIMSAVGHGASAFLHTSENLLGFLMSNQEFEITVKLRIGAKIHSDLPDHCTGEVILDSAGDHLLKCKWGNEGKQGI
jgi:hypothetical protein